MKRYSNRELRDLVRTAAQQPVRDYCLKNRAKKLWEDAAPDKIKHAQIDEVFRRTCINLTFINCVQVPEISTNDLDAALKVVKPTTTKDDIKEIDKFDKQSGTE